jgi:putative heme transporter
MAVLAQAPRAGIRDAAAVRDAAGVRDAPAGPVPAVPRGAARPASRRALIWAWVLTAGVLAVIAVRSPDAVGDVWAVFAHTDGLRPAWLVVAVTAQVVSLAGGVAAQRQLLAAAGARLPWPTLSALVLASTGLARVMPAGPVTGGAWQAREYRRRGAGTAAAVWAVLAGGFASTVAALVLLMAGAAIAGASPLRVLACTGAALAAAAAGLAAASRRVRALGGRLSRRHHRWPTIGRLAADVAWVSHQRAGPGRAAGVLACTITGLLADVGVLAACFGLAGLPVPWRGLLFAYAAGQLAGRLVPLPGGLGGVEGGLLGALTLTGTPPTAVAAAVIVYRVAGYWAVGAAGTAVAATLARRRPRTPGREGPRPSADLP